MLIWGNHEYCAFDLVHPWYTQELRKLGEIIHCVNTQSINGTYLCALWENIKLEWCSSQPLTAILLLWMHSLQIAPSKQPTKLYVVGR